MTNLPRFTLIAGLALGLAACAGKQPVALEKPPETAQPVTPVANADPIPVTETAAPVQPAYAPGSQEDLRAQTGSDTVLFGYDSYELDAEAKAVLARHAQWLRQNPAVRVTLEGHTDERGTREYNLALGDRRANSAKNFLATQGIDVARLATISYGKERPAVDGSDEAAWAKNRRAVTVVMGR
ncbi:peptidoglycan-associated lipoprotein [Sandarakinorhabdus cyanobacteriorum]|uniref:Peptidoglycan-associated lipoprotein n=1 Tax=Sandarakinorhabdus cyanobacteriorum TaxID=1981098 RepID=A0A255YI98_9SPHN|nr:peptidoglycan-associated lipoprotein Pal [Sandarakinorhabdus cyanobacteriorum]OYQ28190.1 peptidoglycan-associated lipoprotein [Sandarakinorhabdus cyanobacteriorum]